MSATEINDIDNMSTPPKHFIRKIPEEYLNPSELYFLIKKLGITEISSDIAGLENLNKSLELCHLPSASANLLKNVTFSFAGATYDISYTFGINHTLSKGGKATHITSLRKNEKQIMVGILVVFYTTHADDSDDYEASKEKTSYLLEHDELAEKTLASIS